MFFWTDTNKPIWLAWLGWGQKDTFGLDFRMLKKRELSSGLMANLSYLHTGILKCLVAMTLCSLMSAVLRKHSLPRVCFFFKFQSIAPAWCYNERLLSNIPGCSVKHAMLLLTFCMVLKWVFNVSSEKALKWGQVQVYFHSACPTLED